MSVSTGDSLAIATILAAGITSGASTVAALLTQRTHRAVQPNGETISELLHRVIELGEYQHTRNHDILNALATTQMMLTEIARRQGWWPEPAPPTKDAL